MSTTRLLQLLRVQLAQESTSAWYSDRDRFQRSTFACLDRAEAQYTEELKRGPRQLYELTCRNLLLGVWTGNDLGEFIGIREKCGTFRLDAEGATVQQAVPIHIAVPDEIGPITIDNYALFDFLAKLDGARTGRVITRGPKAGDYEVVVGNIGTVYVGDSEKEARDTFASYAQMALGNDGRAGGESVTLFRDGEPIDECQALTEPSEGG